MANFLTSPQKLAHSLTVTILLISFHSSYGYYYLEEKSCGVLFSDANYGGLQYQMNDRDQSIYLKEDLRAAEDGWNVTGSLQIESGCTMQICNETYFDGSCQTVLSGNYSVTTTLNLTNIESVMCSCPKVKNNLKAYGRNPSIKFLLILSLCFISAGMQMFRHFHEKVHLCPSISKRRLS